MRGFINVLLAGSFIAASSPCLAQNSGQDPDAAGAAAFGAALGGLVGGVVGAAVSHHGHVEGADFVPGMGGKSKGKGKGGGGSPAAHPGKGGGAPGGHPGKDGPKGGKHKPGEP